MVQMFRGELSAFIPDIHAPHEDKRAIDTVCEFLTYLKPKHLFFQGDGFDFYQISKYDKRPARLLELQQDLDHGFQVIDRIRACAPQADAHMVEGNHERRLQKYLNYHPEIAGLRCLEIEELLQLRKLDIRWYPEEEVLEHHGFVVTHGTRVSKHAGMSAKAELEKWGCCGISGHTHRMAAFLQSNYGGDFVWYEGGCLCELNPCYVVGRPNWQHGISIGDFLPDENRFTIHQLWIDRQYRILHHGKLFDGKEKPKPERVPVGPRAKPFRGSR